MIRLSTIQKKQWVGITGLAMVGFVLAHLSGNFLIFKGAEAYNGYAKFLHDLGPLLWGARLGLLSAFVVHMGLTMNLVITNKRARKARYYKYQNHRNESSLATRLMPLTGTVIFLYIIFHLLDFSLADKVGLIQGVEYGLFGLVVNTLGNPIHAVLYIIAMACVGLHMYHAFQSVFQTFGILSDRNQAVVSNVSKGLGVGIAIAYSAIPIYILLAF
jgi:succinate dehydrogenase / fumarate reductase cytochrome b subunit